MKVRGKLHALHLTQPSIVQHVAFQCTVVETLLTTSSAVPPSASGTGLCFPPAPPANLPEKPAGDGLAACQDLVRSVHLDCMRQHGLPREWLDCEVMLAPHQGKTSFAILFVVKKWSDELLQHLPAYESSFKFQLDMVSATLSQRVRVMAWHGAQMLAQAIQSRPCQRRTTGPMRPLLNGI